MDRWEEKENRNDVRAGLIAVSALNGPHFVSKDHKPRTLWDIFPHLPKPRSAEPDKFKAAVGFFAAHNAKVAKLEGRKRKAG